MPDDAALPEALELCKLGVFPVAAALRARDVRIAYLEEEVATVRHFAERDAEIISALRAQVAQLRLATKLSADEMTWLRDYERSRELGCAESASRAAHNLWKIVTRIQAALAATAEPAHAATKGV